jgi:hypothetical protein
MAAQQTNTSDMRAVHGAFRATLPGASALVAAAEPGDIARAAVVANFYDNVLDFLEVHHAGEDELVWPKLLERCPEDAEQVSTIAGQHQAVVELVGLARQQLTEWAATGGAAAGTRAAATLSGLDSALIPHMDQEEEAILPLCAVHLTPEEWAELPAHGFAHFSGDKPWVVLGLILAQVEAMGGPQAAAGMVAQMPPPARQMWTGFGKSAFEGLSSELGLA